MHQQMLKYLSRMRRKQDLERKARTLSKHLTVTYFKATERLRTTHILSNLFVPCDLEKLCNFADVVVLLRVTKDTVPSYRTVMYRTVPYRTELCY